VPARRKIIHFSFGSSGRPASKPSEPGYYLGGWATHQAKALARADDRIAQEVWRPEYRLDRIGAKRVDGVTGRLFPSPQWLRRIHLNPVSMLLELRRECRKNRVILCLHYSYELSSIIILFLFRKFPIVVQQHGSIPFHRIRRGFFGTLRMKMLDAVNARAFRFVDLFSVISKVERDELTEKLGADRVVFRHGRKYFDEWLPGDKREAKRRLGFDPDTKIMLSIGHLNRIRGVDAVLEAFDRLKRERKIRLLLIGGSESDELVPEARRSGAVLTGVVPNRRLPLYYRAADVYVYFSENQRLREYAGIGTAPIEAMACDVPVVSPQLIHFPTDEWRAAGEIPADRGDLADCIRRVLDHPGRYAPRKTARRHYDFGGIIARDLSDYERLFREYYGE
jgi:glycosyltransferase involved in cell wall biosynthesis